jgi:starch synthase
MHATAEALPPGKPSTAWEDWSVGRRILFATAEFAPAVRVGGLAAATAGLVKALRALGVEVEVVLPDYLGSDLDGARSTPLDVPGWAAPAVARRGRLAGVGEVTLVSVPGIERPHPYVGADGQGWPDNDRRFLAFAAAVGALAAHRRPDVLHLNDWHTAPAVGFVHPCPPTVLTIHTLGHQGWADAGWAASVPHYPEAFRVGGGFNALAGGIARADLVVAVSPTYADEIRTRDGGAGLDGLLRAKGDRLVGIRNGIDTDEWDPSTDAHLPARYGPGDPGGKAVARAALAAEVGWPDEPDVPIVSVVSRLVDQKGIDLLLPLVPYLRHLPARLAVLGDGDAALVQALHVAAAADPDRVAFRAGYDEGFAHRLFAGGDLFAMPSRFEPCGLAQMQAMRYGTPPVVTDVGGLHDTVVDADDDPARGSGFVVAQPTALAVLDGLHRAVRAWRDPARRLVLQRNGMRPDWSWRQPAEHHLAQYDALVGASS